MKKIDVFIKNIEGVPMSNKQLKKNKGGRPIADTRRVALTLANSDYEVLEKIALRTNTRPATMIRGLVVECMGTYNAMLAALDAIDSGEKPKALSLMEKSLREAQAKAENEIEKSKK